NLRAYDAATGRWLWAFGGSSDLHGLTAGGEGAIYLPKPTGTKGLITRIDAETGKVAPWGDGDSGTFAVEGGADLVGLAALGGRLYAADARANVLRYGTSRPPALDRTIAVAAPTSPAADPATGRLWVISGG